VDELKTCFYNLYQFQFIGNTRFCGVIEVVEVIEDIAMYQFYNTRPAPQTLLP
jgi:hypothetical protein